MEYIEPKLAAFITAVSSAANGLIEAAAKESAERIGRQMEQMEKKIEPMDADVLDLVLTMLEWASAHTSDDIQSEIQRAYMSLREFWRPNGSRKHGKENRPAAGNHP